MITHPDMEVIMTADSLIIAVTVGIVIGVVGRVVVCRGRAVPWWLPAAAGVAAAVLVTVVAWMADADRSGPTALEVLLQVLSAAAGVAVVAVTTERVSDETRWEPRSGKVN
jgi:hypothetical protein